MVIVVVSVICILTLLLSLTMVHILKLMCNIQQRRLRKRGRKYDAHIIYVGSKAKKFAKTTLDRLECANNNILLNMWHHGDVALKVKDDIMSENNGIVILATRSLFKKWRYKIWLNQQRKLLKLVVNHATKDSSFGLIVILVESVEELGGDVVNSKVWRTLDGLISNARCTVLSGGDPCVAHRLESQLEVLNMWRSSQQDKKKNSYVAI